MPGVTTRTVAPEESGQKLERYLFRRTGAPRSLIMRWVRKGEVRVNRKRSKPFDRVRTGDEVRIPPHDPPAGAGEDASGPPMEITARGKEWLALAKPAGLPTHGGTGHADSVAARLGSMFPGAGFAPTPAHRLDRDTSGILLAALSYRELVRLQQCFRAGEVDKRYLCWASGETEPGSVLELEDRLEKSGPPGREKVQATGNTDAGKRASATAVVLETRKGASLLEVRLFTGRTHQIRAQLSTRGLPIVGDVKYGGPHLPGGGTMLLHCWRLAFPGGEARLLPDWDEPFRVWNPPA